MAQVVPTLHTRTLGRASFRHHPSFSRLHLICGAAYVVLTLVSSTYYLSVLRPALFNDFWWTDYNASSHQALLVDLFNARLATHSNGSLDLLASYTFMDKTYTSPVSTTAIYQTYVRHLILTELTSIEYAIVNLRALSGHHCMWMSTQYCWVDLTQAFPVARTAARQQRCRDKYATNGAVYMETVLRNQDWTDFTQNYGGDGGLFTVAIQSWLDQLPHGQRFLAETANARYRTSVDAEVAYWRTFEIATFQLQWQNLWLIGLSEKMTVTNALLWQQDIVLKALPRSFQAWTTGVMNWMPLKDLSAMQGSNRSLVRNANHSFASAPAINFEDLLGLRDNSGHFTNQRQAFRTSIGPFNAVDMFVLAVPPSLQALYETFEIALHDALDTEPRGRAMMDTIDAFTLAPLPSSWQDLVLYGGNPMCLYGLGQATAQQTVGFYDNCVTPSHLDVAFTKYSSVFAALALDEALSIPSICNVTSLPLTCQAKLLTVAQSSSLLPSVALAMQAQVRATTTAIHALNVGLMQYASNAAATNWSILHEPMLDDAMAFFGWAMLYDWIQGTREVVSFQGDVGTIVLMSTRDVPQLFPSSTSIVKAASKYIFELVQYVTTLLGVVGGLCATAAIFATVHAPNLVWFNRVGGSIWIGRPLLCLRGITAVLLLSTSQLQPELRHAFHPPSTRFAIQPRLWPATLVVAGEATWMLYVAQDTLTLVAPKSTTRYGPLSCVLAWAALAILDTTEPVVPKAILNRQCQSHDMDLAVQCTAGVVAMGSFSRVGSVLGILALSLVLSAAVVAWPRTTPRQLRTASVLSPFRHELGTADVFLDDTSDSTMNLWSLDKVSCILAGLVTFTWRGRRYVFNVKLWTLRADKLSTTRVSTFLNHNSVFESEHLAPFVELYVSSTQHVARRWSVVVAGFIYLVAAIVTSITYVHVSEQKLANDLFWGSFNMTGAHAFLANWFNQQLLLGEAATTTTLSLSTNAINQDGSFDQPTASVTSAANFGALLQYSTLNTPAAAIAGLRASDACVVPWIFTQYCFVDFGQTWHLANTVARQTRCQNMATNGAVFLEAVLRNVNIQNFRMCWGDAFDLTIARELGRSTGGQSWLAKVTAPQLSIDDEVAVWAVHGLHHFTTQWQNFKSIGLANTYAIQNVFGFQHPFTLQYQLGAFRLEKQTTWKMYWGLANDWTAGVQNASGVGGRSLVTSSPDYAFANTSMEAVLLQNGTLSAPLGTAFSLVRTVVGPFGSIDTQYISCPAQAKYAVLTIFAALQRALAASTAAQVAFNNINLAWSIYPTPKAWSDVDFVSVGGSPLCPEYSFASSSPISTGLTILTSWQFGCFLSATAAYVNPSRETMIASVVLSGLPSTAHMQRICQRNINFVASCQLFLNQTSSFVASYVPASDLLSLEPLAVDATTAIRALNVQFMQYGMMTNGSPLQLFRLNVLDANEVDFAFFAWIFLVDWTLGFREAVSFQGDVGTLAVLTDYLDPLVQQVNVGENVVNASYYFRAATLYVTYTMIVLAILLLVYFGLCRGQAQVLNLFLLSRVGAIVWIGRPILLLRSLAAIGLLSTCALDLQTTGYLSYFQDVQPSLLVTLLAANEVTWLVAVVNDIAFVVTEPFAAKYDDVENALVLVVTAAISIAAPVAHSVTIDAQCTLTHMQVTCASGVVVVGDSVRLVTLVVVAVVMNLMCYVVCRMWCRTFNIAPNPIVPSAFLYCGANALFCRTGWMVGDVYFMDRMSAVLNGILTVRWHDTIYGLDVKLWRMFHIELSQPSGSHGDCDADRSLASLRQNAFPLSSRM
ncbi:Aste57867_15277 [Aphanomyces stellatus]|uniref:Aste57867_15277 protein n=1 Tax=Aphanomyces stellatus TaxID=120398 RepID=A0A485L2T4_9STRA|nr:hypothetical protein As57867_015221 [Aphanomyces stellatus]VFT92086.1 Aste57867_15277 [Aphanomyces stellatus]